MNRQVNESNRVVLTSEQIEWYIAHARQLRNEVILRGLNRAYSQLRDGTKWVVARLRDVFHSSVRGESGAHRAC
jgi:hypothetical protein